jgi:hypothetical protein
MEEDQRVGVVCALSLVSSADDMIDSTSMRSWFQPFPPTAMMLGPTMQLLYYVAAQVCPHGGITTGPSTLVELSPG